MAMLQHILISRIFHCVHRRQGSCMTSFCRFLAGINSGNLSAVFFFFLVGSPSPLQSSIDKESPLKVISVCRMRPALPHPPATQIGDIGRVVFSSALNFGVPEKCTLTPSQTWPSVFREQCAHGCYSCVDQGRSIPVCRPTKERQLRESVCLHFHTQSFDSGMRVAVKAQSICSRCGQSCRKT